MKIENEVMIDAGSSVVFAAMMLEYSNADYDKAVIDELFVFF